MPELSQVKAEYPKSHSLSPGLYRIEVDHRRWHVVHEDGVRRSPIVMAGYLEPTRRIAGMVAVAL